MGVGEEDCPGDEQSEKIDTALRISIFTAPKTEN